VPRAIPWSVTLPPYGYRFFTLTARKRTGA
jgi:hypothetical protein